MRLSAFADTDAFAVTNANRSFVREGGQPYFQRAVLTARNYRIIFNGLNPRGIFVLPLAIALIWRIIFFISRN